MGNAGQIEAFDERHFGVSAAEAALMDPQQRLALTGALEVAAAVAPQAPGALTDCLGVYVGVAFADYASLLRAHAAGAPPGPYTATGGTLSVVAGRLSYAFGARGPSVR